MNQILVNKKDNLKKKKKYSILFYTSFLLVISIIIYFSWKKYNENIFSITSDATNKSYSITRLYSNSTNTNVSTNNRQAEIIGTIKIPKINISYPIFSEYTDEHLKISVCKFYGPDLNSPGNLCIIGHNYNNGVFFSNLYKLNLDDIINIYDLSSNSTSYYIYDIFEIDANNLKYLDQNTNREKRNHINYM